MADVAPPRPLEREDDRDGFDCGRDSMNLWFRRHGLFNHENNISRVNVMTVAGTRRVVGYVTLSAAQIERGVLPKALQRNRPDPVPATLLGQLAVDRNFQGRGHAASLLVFALRTSIRAADIIGGMCVITHPLDAGVRGFYRRWGFVDLPFDARSGMIVRMADLRESFAAAS